MLRIFVAVIAAFVLTSGARLSAPTARADTTGGVALGCEFLAASIDGNLDDVTLADPLGDSSDLTAACDGISATEIDNLAHVLGNANDVLEQGDFGMIDGDDNQVVDGGGSTYIFEFVNDNAPVTFDLPLGLTVVNGDGTGAFAGGIETCGTPDVDPDCDAAGAGDLDGVVVAKVTDGSASAGATLTVVISQEAVENMLDIVVTGPPREVSLSPLESTIQTSGSTAGFTACKDGSNVFEFSQHLDANRTLVGAFVTDLDGTKLARVPVRFTIDAVASADFDADDVTEIASDPKSFTDYSRWVSYTLDPASLAVICGGTVTGAATITATINPTLVTEDSASATISVVALASVGGFAEQPDVVGLSSSASSANGRTAYALGGIVLTTITGAAGLLLRRKRSA